ILAVLVVLMACTGGANPGLPASPGSPAVPQGGTLRVGITSGTKRWDPQADSGDNNVLELERCCVGRTLLSYRAGTTAEGGTVLQPDLAASLPEVSNDGLTWTFHLNPGLHYGPPFQDVEITAPDIVRAVERALDQTVIRPAAYWPALYRGVIVGAAES